MATGKPRIFELAKELGMSSKDLLGLFGRLGLEAKNQLSVVEPKVADLLRAQLKAKAAPKPARPAAPVAPVATAEPIAAAAAPANVPTAPVAAQPPFATATPAAPAPPAIAPPAASANGVSGPA